MYANNEVSNKISASILPKTSQAGTKIGLIALGYTFKKSTLKEAQNTLKQMGYKTDHTKRISKSFGYFSNTDEERAADINEMFANKKIDAILWICGSYGYARILHLIDYDFIKKNPKALIGYSDVTAIT